MFSQCIDKVMDSSAVTASPECHSSYSVAQRVWCCPVEPKGRSDAEQREYDLERARPESARLRREETSVQVDPEQAHDERTHRV